MTNLPPTVSMPPIKTPIVDITTGLTTRYWAQFFELLLKRTGDSPGDPVIGDIAVYEVTLGFGDVASAASKALLTAKTGETWKVREIYLSGAGTDFSGGGGDRLMAITDGTSTWSIIPAATLQTLAVARWGDAGTPFPATAAHLTTASVLSTNISAKYSGGATDYTAGSLTLIVVAERIT